MTKYGLFGSVAAAVFAACSVPMAVPTQLAPETLPDAGSAPITFTRMIMRIPAGTELGHHHDGILKLEKFPYTWQSNLTVASDEFRLIASEELRQYGYDVKGGDNLLFGADESSKAEYQLGGTLTEVFHDTYGALAGNYSEARLHIEWQLFNALRREVVFADTTDGYAKQDGHTAAVVQNAFRSAIHNLMANPRFVEIVQKRPSELWEGRAAELPRTAIDRCKAQVTALPRDLEKALDAVLVIRTGGSVGSGVIVSGDGYALTAAHVVTGLQNVVVRLHSGLELAAQVVATDDAQDVALIKLPGRGFPCLPVNPEKPPDIGTELYAIGAPASEELAYSVTKGIVSGVRKLQQFSYVQTDASLNPGNSGGPLLAPDARIVGVVSWKIAAPGFEGLSFGVPVDALAIRLAIDWR